jgi:hypothetical protein
VTKKKAVSSGRPSPFTKLNMELVKYMYETGSTDKQVAERVGVTYQTINNWKKKHPDFFDSLKDWKDQADKVVEASLYQRACGYVDKEVKVFCDAKTGLVTQTTVDKRYAPDPTSMIFWLKNRKPKNWRDKQEIEQNSTININLDDDDLGL